MSERLHICPDCGRPLTVNDDPSGPQYYCKSCGGEYEDTNCCSHCHEEVVVVQLSSGDGFYCKSCAKMVNQSQTKLGYKTLTPPR